jgi:predicted phage terminase large subunit-like protein
VWEEGDILWPEREGRAELDAARERIGSYAYQSQYLGDPGLRGGSLFQLDWLKEFHDLPVFDRTVMSLDTAFSTKATADYSACVVVGFLAEPDGSHAPGYYVTRCWRGRVSFGDLKQTAVTLFHDHNPDEVLIETKASGQSLIQELMAETALPVIAVDADTDKVTRANAISPLFESGRVFLPEDQIWLQQGGRWVRDLRAELLAFPHGKNDDHVDALVHALSRLRHHQDQAAGWARALAGGARFNPETSPALIAQRRAEARALAGRCPVCHKPIPIVRHQPVYTIASGERCHEQCQGKPEQRTETIRGEKWTSPFNLIPHTVRLR